jgi:hypothetical protein
MHSEAASGLSLAIHRTSVVRNFFGFEYGMDGEKPCKHEAKNNDAPQLDSLLDRRIILLDMVFPPGMLAEEHRCQITANIGNTIRSSHVVMMMVRQCVTYSHAFLM